VGSAKTCAATDSCHAAGVCDPASGQCSNPNAANGKTCNDAKNCTTGDVCTNGVCGGAAVTCAAPTACHTQGVCVEATGVCSNPVAADGAACSDGNACTQSDSCAAGVCKGGNPVSCTGAGACTDAGTCNPATGTCSGGAPKPNGTVCSDGLACTTADVCTGGVCGGAPKCAAGQSCSEPAGTCTGGGNPWDRGAACNTCEAGGIDSGDCDANIGCKNVTDPADKALCEALDTCMRKTGCWSKDPLDCLCGTASGTACASAAANGVCKAEIQAATKTTDPVANGTLFYSFSVPAGFATQQSACDRDICPIDCKFP
jgi:hypothetical protein